ncbi:MAG: MBL fold metallo-hydrolase [Clostridia bacterium]|nr:MBL fold metallo-hydrolase [Clostridia bacterium]
MKISVLPVGMIQANCYLVYEAESKEALVIDPGAKGARIQQEIEKLELKVKYLVNTHGHSDHIGANQFLKEVTGAPLYIHEADSSMLTDAKKNISAYLGREINGPAADRHLQDGDILEVGDLRFQVLHTPGHTPGGICLVGHGVCFSGDTLFAGSIGRTDLPDGSFEALLNSIRTKLLVLADDVVVYPGHGSQTTIGDEKSVNPYFG